MATAKLPWMPFYGGDFYESEHVMLMEPAEEAIYLRLLWRQWREGSLPADPTQCAILARVGTVPAIVLDRFPLCSQSRRKNPKLEEIRNQQLETQDKLSQAGKRGRAKQLESAQTSLPIGDVGEARGRPGAGPDEARAGLGQSDIDTDTEEELDTEPEQYLNTEKIVETQVVPNVTTWVVPNGTNSGGLSVLTSTKPKVRKKRIPRDALPRQPTWIQEAATIHQKFIGYLAHGRIGRALKPLVDDHGWTVVKPVFTWFCEFACVEDYLARAEAGQLREGEQPVKSFGWNTSVESFAARFTSLLQKVSA